MQLSCENFAAINFGRAYQDFVLEVDIILGINLLILTSAKKIDDKGFASLCEPLKCMTYLSSIDLAFTL